MGANTVNLDRSLPPLLLAVALVLAQSLALVHQQSHLPAADTSICDSCLAAQTLDSGLSGEPVALEAEPASLGVFQARIGSFVPAQHDTPYRTRAPPAA